ncbi:MAG: cyclase family protein [Propionibacteriales bacterium]|nr:cyclase family protein [Propionibacteriales bacterium]
MAGADDPVGALDPVRGPGNWGRWGAEDERGAVNLITGDRVLAACRGPRQGGVYELGIELRRNAPVGGERTAPMHFMVHDGGDFAALERHDWGTADDYLTLYPQGTTHIDGLAHMWSGGRLYNGFSYREVRSSGAGRLGVEKLGGIVTTAHLLDFADRAGDRNSDITVDDIEAHFARVGARPEPGDALLFRTGWMDAALAAEPLHERGFAVVAPGTADWFAAHDIAVVGADNIAVEAPGRRGALPPLHARLVCELGVTLIEMLDLRQPAMAGVTTGMLVVAPLRISRGVGSPVNPLLVT